MPRIVHLGVGNFFRAHQAWYTQHANRITDSDWRITGVSLRRPDMRNALRAQNYAYGLVIDGSGEARFETITVMDQILVATEGPGAVVAAIADPEVSVVTLTITEKGYLLDPSTGRPNLSDPLLVKDIAGQGPLTALGFLVRALDRRRRLDAPPITIVCCDNLANNGTTLRRAVLDVAWAMDVALAAWIEGAVTFPNTMVDRIVPHTTDDVRTRVLELTGRSDAWPVATEAFSEWVIEDAFGGPGRIGRKPAQCWSITWNRLNCGSCAF